MKRLAAGLAAGMMLFIGCHAAPIGPDPALDSLLFEISDAMHGDEATRNAHFYFLPPLVPDPVFEGEFDGTLAPTVVITEEGMPFTELTPTVSLEDEHYQVHWHTNEFSLDTAKTYRIGVFVDDQQLGFADVDVVASGKELKIVNTGEYIALKDRAAGGSVS